MAIGFSQVDGIEYDETFAPFSRYSSIRSILSLSTQMGWQIHQMDVKTTFLNGVIEEEVYIEQPEVLRPLTGSRMCADSREHCMG